MSNLSFDPVVGEEVHTPGHYGGPFKIEAVHPTSSTGLGTVDLRQIGNGYFLPGVPWSMLQFDETRRVRRAIDWLKANSAALFPKYVLDYQVESRRDHLGIPAFFVRFFVQPDNQPSPEKINELNRFVGSVETMLLSLGLDRWPYVQVSEKRSLLDVAS